MVKAKGLTTLEVQERLKVYGPNIIPEEKPRFQFFIFLDQLKNPLVYILILAAAITIFLKDFKDTAVITFAIFINTILGFIQEARAQKSLWALKKILTPKARVWRDGKLTEILAQDLVPGDIVVLETGDKIPADGKLLEGIEILVNEAILTGESVAVEKSLQEEKNKVFLGTTVVSGRGKMEVEVTGLATKLGRIAAVLETTPKEATPLEKKLAELAKTLAILVGGLTLVIFLLGFLVGKKVGEMFLTSVALAVAAIPEGLVVALTAILAVGMQRILKQKALVRKLIAAETLGSTTVICTDKTGTLTEGKFKVIFWDVKDQDLGLKTTVLCNNLSDPQELSLWEFAQAQNHFDPQEVLEESPRVLEIPFSSERKFMATINGIRNQESGIRENVLFLKGAPEKILGMAKMTLSEKTEWEEKVERWAKHGARVLGMGYKQIAKRKKLSLEDLLRDDLTFLGLVGFSDPVRKEARQSLKICQEAGIKVKVLTGDFRTTSEVVLREVGIKVKASEILEGKELEHLPPEELKERVLGVKLFVRIDPFQKLRIVEALQKNGEVVALIGDGVNDAPALKRADIGVVVGEASEVAKETSDMVLLDSNFQTIVAAVEEGRGIFANLQKVITYLLADAFSAIGLVAGSLVLGLPLPLTASQILWVNLISDGFPNLALTIDPKEKNLMRFPPRPQEAIINWPTRIIIALVSGFTALLALLFFSYFLKTQNLALSQSAVFALLGLTTLFYVFSCRNLTQPLFKTNFLDNPWLILAILGGLVLVLLPFKVTFVGQFLGIMPLESEHWVIILVIVLTIIALIEVAKWVLRFFQK